MRRATVFFLALALAGCLQTKDADVAGPADADDGVSTLQVTVVDKATGEGLGGAKVELLVVGKGALRKTADVDGNVTFSIEPAPACTLSVEHDGFRSAGASLDCRIDGRFRLALTSTASPSSSPTAPRPARPPVGVAAPGSVLVQGTVLDATAADPIAGVTVQLDAPAGPSQRTGLDGAYAFFALPGGHTLTLSAACWIGLEIPIEVEADAGGLLFDVQLAASTVPPAVPTGVRATAGPGPGMVTVSWQDVPGAAGFDLLRDGALLVPLDHSLAYGVPGASAADRFSVAARDACGQSGAASAEVSADPLPGPEPMLASANAPDVEVGEESYLAFDASGAALPNRAWRTVTGTGNCCENYMTTTPSGRILDQGGSRLAYSDDEGRTWSGVQSPLIALAGEGSVAAAPDGDIVAFDWATYNADTAFAYRYSAATKTWQTAPVAKVPFFDRPWIATIKGPFFVDDLVIPYVSVVEGGYPLKDPLLVSFDGLHYVPSNSLAQAGEAGVDLGVILTAPDRNRDWLPPLASFGIVPVDNGVGLMEFQGAMQGSPTWRPVQLPQVPGDILRVDSQGGLHSVSIGEGSFEYSISHDGGAHWQRTTTKLPKGWSAGEWDFRANAEQDQAVFAVNADVEGHVQQAAFRFRGLDGVPVLAEVLHVGSGTGVFGSGVAEQGNRFDFMTLGFLPDGRIVMSAADGEHSNPFLAIELPATS